MIPENTKLIHVAAAAIVDPRGRILLTQRHFHTHQGGLWEFPGGKLEADETAEQALVRELEEELGMTPTSYRPLIRVRHQYGERNVLLDVWRVDRWRGEPHGREGQPLEWMKQEDLGQKPLPPADRPIVTAVRLPDRYLITPDPGSDEATFLNGLEVALERGIRLIQLRAKALSPDRYRRLAVKAGKQCRAHGAWLLLNAPPEMVKELGGDGVHLTGPRLMQCRERPLERDRWVAASCHNREELAHARRVGVDFVVASPVQPTLSHPDAAPLGWDGFGRLTDLADIPVYALGGMELNDLPVAWENGGQGIAAIRGLWGRL
ncbi:MAG: Nudix family hydrolase [Gammaproteobacteria bacterium]|nr:Nudix family hydrolase [Gammaproteobacteria bacterium]